MCAQKRCLCMTHSVVVAVEQRSREVCALGQHQLQRRYQSDLNYKLAVVWTYPETNFATTHSSPSCCRRKTECSSAADAERPAFRLENSVSMDDEKIDVLRGILTLCFTL
jgi:hypothetical protein